MSHSGRDRNAIFSPLSPHASSQLEGNVEKHSADGKHSREGKLGNGAQWCAVRASARLILAPHAVNPALKGHARDLFAAGPLIASR
ncbi:hypothetical protein EYF80_003610 [Liparis tanakae]|uniref:Uncharacterized protein n=1 Tax=Liparis tanakae TaxID=230148 RepID=A0A4Z2J955_9TELE|nr:hypothetical protein EYF80_003610 [Liparis tanakae]